jgi:hypothetical protein
MASDWQLLTGGCYSEAVVLERDIKRFQGLHSIIRSLLTIRIREKSKQRLLSIKNELKL